MRRAWLWIGLAALLGACEGDAPLPTASDGAPPPTNGPSATPRPSANRPPTLEFRTAEPSRGVILRITQVAFLARAEDPDGDALRYVWDFDDGNPPEEGGAGISHVFDKTGSMVVRVRVEDGRGGQASGNLTVNVDSLSGRYHGLMTNGPNGGVRLGGTVTQTGRRFDGAWSSFNGDGTGDSRGLNVGGVVSDPRNMTFTAFGLCGNGDAVFRGSFNEDLSAFNGEGPGCEGSTFRRIELYR